MSEEILKQKLADCQKHVDALHADKMHLTRVNAELVTQRGQQRALDERTALELIASAQCRGNRHEAYLENCPVCMSRMFHLHEMFIDTTHADKELRAEIERLQTELAGHRSLVGVREEELRLAQERAEFYRTRHDAREPYVQHKPDCPALPANAERFTVNGAPLRTCACGLADIAQS